MSYPTFPGKHRHEALFHPADYIAYRKLNKKLIPKKIIILYQRSPFNYFLRTRRGKYKKIDIFKGRGLHIVNGIGVIYLQGIGAPYATTLLEELIAAGATEFISMGTAGGLQSEGFFLCTKAIRDEGVSRHYLTQSKYATPSAKLTQKLGGALTTLQIPHTRGVTWTIDAPYRETKKEIAQYQKEGVVTVEMEAAALFAVGKYRKVAVASAFVVSDVIHPNKWQPKFHTINLQKSLNQLFEASFHALQYKS